MKFVHVARKFGLSLLGPVASFAVVGAASAQTASMDVSGVTSTIAEGVTALGLIGVAWVGFVYLKKAWNKL